MFAFPDTERLIHSIKTVIACILGILVAKFVGLPSGLWIIITILVIMCAQLYVGSVINKSYARFLGTLAGCLFATAAIIIMEDKSYAALVAVCSSGFFFSYVATGNEKFVYTGSLGAATTAIIMLGQPHPGLLLAGQRFLEISIGILIAAFVSQFILPIHASTHLRRAQANTLAMIREFYTMVMMQEQNASLVDLQDLDEKIAKSLSKQRQLAKESAAEPLAFEFNPTHFLQSLYCEKEILRSIVFMNEAIGHIHNTALPVKQLPATKKLNETVMQFLTALKETIEIGEGAKNPVHILSIQTLQMELRQSITSGPDEMLYTQGFLFSAERLINSLLKLADLHWIRFQTF